MVHRRLLAATVAVCALVLSSVGSAPAEPPAPALSGANQSADFAFDAWLDDPWLTEAGPVLREAAAAAIERDRVVEAWRAAPATPHARTAALRRLRLEYGLGDLQAAAHVTRAAATSDEEATRGIELARELAPHMPALHWAQVQDLWRSREAVASVKELGVLLWELGQELESQLWLVGNALLLLWIVALASAVTFIALLAVKASPHAAHDFGDLLSGGMPTFARFALLASALMLPLWLGEGLLGLTLALFAVGFLYGSARERGILVMAAILWIVALHPLAKWASIAATLADLDPVARSVVAVTKGTASRADVERLEAAFDEDPAAAHAIAYRARRFGLEDLARESLDSLAKRHPADAVVLANRANIDMREGRTEAAIHGYERAVAQTASATLLFDLSQAYAIVLRIDESEAALARAQRIGDREVAALSSLSDPKLVADLPYPVEVLRDRIRVLGLAENSSTLLTQTLAPGRLGESEGRTAGGFAAAVLIAMLMGSRFDRSSACTRCGRRICTRCEGTVWSDDLCEDCHHLFRNPEATDPKLRMARLQTLSRRDARLNLLIDVGAIVVPGVAGLSLRRPDVALLGVASFAWILAWWRWPSGILVDPMWLGAFAPVCFAVLGTAALAAHVAIIVGSLVARRNR